MADERIRRDSVTETRGPREKESRHIHEERRETSDRERVQAFIQELDAEILPTLPRIDGYHTVWLSSTHQTDSVHRRARMGYEPIKPEDLPPGYEHLCGPKGTQTAGFVTCNEMVGYKIPMSLYQAIMQHFHHDQPLSTEEQIRTALEDAIAQSDGDAELEEGFKTLGKYMPAPREWEG